MSITDLVDAPPQVEKFAGLTIAKAAENPNQRLKMLVYGDSGKGKSVFAASAHAVAEMSPVLYISAEAGTLSVAKFFPEVEVIQVTEFMQMEAILNQLRRGKHQWRTVVIDSLTELHRLSMDKIMDDVVKKDSERDPEVASQREWGKASLQLQKLIRYFRDLPMHVIFVALEATQGEDNQINVIGPALPGKLLKEVPGYMDVVSRMYTRLVTDPNDKDNKIAERNLWTGPHPKVLSKDRSDGIPGKIQNPTMAIVYDAFTKALNK